MACYITEIFAYSGRLISVVVVQLTYLWEIVELPELLSDDFFFLPSMTVQNLNSMEHEVKLNSFHFWFGDFCL